MIEAKDQLLGAQARSSTTFLETIVLLIGILFCFAADAEAEQPARLLAKVINKTGDPVAGVMVTITHRTETTYEKKKTTDKKGRFHLLAQTLPLFDDCFVLSFEAEGYQPLEAWERLIPGQSVRAVYTLHRDNGVAYHNKGVTALQAGNLIDAEALFQQALDAQPESTLTHYALAELYLSLGKNDQALESAKAALEDQPDSSISLELLYKVHRALGQYQESQRVLNSLAAHGHFMAAATHSYDLGVDALERGNEPLARESLIAATTFNPDLVEAHIELARLEIETHRPLQAANAATRALMIEADNSEATKLAFRAHCLLNQWQQANTFLKALVAEDPELFDYMLYLWGIELMPSEEAHLARKNFSRLVDGNPDHARARYILGWLAAQAGDKVDARTQLRQFLELAPFAPEAQAARTILTGL